MSIKFDAQGVETAKALLADCPQALRRAAANAANRTLTHLRKEISVQVRREYVVPAGEIKKTLNVRRASRSRISGLISSRGSSLPLNVFRVNIPKKGGSLRVKLRQRAAPKEVKGLFFGTSRKGYTGLMQREHRRSAYPLRVPYGPSVPQMLGNEEVTERLEKEAEKYLNARFLHEVEHQLRVHNGGA